MKLYNYKSFLNESNDHSDIHEICKKYGIPNYNINPDGTIDVDGHVYLQIYKLDKIPLKFNRVSGSFYCYNNRLTSLEGSPKWVGCTFNCGHNRLISLKGCPNYVGSDFLCNDNELTSLKGCPGYVGGNFSCSTNNITSLQYGPKRVTGGYYCYNNNIKDFKGFPEFYEGIFIIDRNPVNELVISLLDIEDEDIFDVKLCQFIPLLNEYDVIRNGKTIIRDRLEAACEGIDIELPENIEIEGYEII